MKGVAPHERPRLVSMLMTGRGAFGAMVKKADFAGSGEQAIAGQHFDLRLVRRTAGQGGNIDGQLVLPDFIGDQLPRRAMIKRMA